MHNCFQNFCKAWYQTNRMIVLDSCCFAITVKDFTGRLSGNFLIEETCTIHRYIGCLKKMYTQKYSISTITQTGSLQLALHGHVVEACKFLIRSTVFNLVSRFCTLTLYFSYHMFNVTSSSSNDSLHPNSNIDHHIWKCFMWNVLHFSYDVFALSCFMSLGFGFA